LTFAAAVQQSTYAIRTLLPEAAMPQHFRCAFGHEWNAAPGQSQTTEALVVCPICGADGAALTCFPAEATRLQAQTLTPSATLDQGAPPPLPDEAPTYPLADGSGPADGALPNVRGYEVLELLGRGGMGVVYKARQLSLKRLVALKMTLAGAHTRPEERQRFKAEAEAVASLQHPHIVQIYEVGEQAGSPFFALEYVAGGSLNRRLSGNPQPSRAAAQLVAVLAHAMHFAHTNGIVHRDLKPSNILLSGEWRVVSGECELAEDRPTLPESSHPSPLATHDSPLATLTPKITDFGLAKQFAEGVELTQSGTIVGTPSYMAPEQARGKSREIGPAADVYALGAILYEMLTGRPPFKAETSWDTLQQVLHEEPVTPSRLQSKVPRDLETICLKCLEKDAGRRYASALALAADLERYLANQPIAARPIGRVGRLSRWGRRHPGVATLSAALVLFLLAGIAGAVVAFLNIDAARSDADANARQAQLNAAESQKRLVRLYVENGMDLLDKGDLTGSLHWFAEALRRDQGEPERELDHRTRLAAVLRQCPKLAQVWFHDGPTTYAGFSSDGSRVITSSMDGMARVWDARSGAALSPELRHPPKVNEARFSPDGSLVVTAGGDGYARVWDVATGESRGVLRHDKEVWSAYFGTDGRSVITASFDGTAHVWEPATGNDLRLTHRHEVWQAALAPDGRLLATICADAVHLWELPGGREKPFVLRHGAAVYGIDFSPDGAWLVSAGGDETARIWEVASGRELRALHQEGELTLARFDRAGRRLVTAGGERARVWNAVTGQPVTPFMHHDFRVWDAAFSDDGRRLVTVNGNLALVWDPETGQLAAPPLKHGGLVNTGSFSPDSRYVVTSGGQTAQIWDLGVAQPLAMRLPCPAPVVDICLSADGKRIASACGDGSVQVWDAEAGRPVKSPPRQLQGLTQILFSPDSRCLLLVCQKEAQLWNLETGSAVAAPRCHDEAIRRALFRPDGQRFVTCSEDGTARLWDTATCQGIGAVMKHGSSVGQAAFSPDSRLLLTASSDRYARLWDAETGQPKGAPLEQKAAVWCVAFGPDDQLFSLAGSEGLAQIGELSSGQLISTPLRHNGPITRIVFSTAGKLLATASSDHTARIWQAATGQPLTPPLEHGKGVTYVAFSSDDRCLLTASDDGTVRLWDTRTGQPLHPPLRHTGPVKKALFSADGRRVLTMNGSTVFVWDLDLTPDSRPVDDLLLGVQLLDQHQIDDTAGFVPLDWGTFQQDWEALRTKYPESFSCTEAEVLRWHRREAQECERLKDWAGAARHLDALIQAGSACWAEQEARRGMEANLPRK
jgi:WD40 repeat protein/serine/threonine protein kinase